MLLFWYQGNYTIPTSTYSGLYAVNIVGNGELMEIYIIIYACKHIKHLHAKLFPRNKNHTFLIDIVSFVGNEMV